MKQETWELIENEFIQDPDIRAEPVPESEFNAAIAELGFSKVDEDYRQFVMRYGGAEVGPNPIYGLRKAPSMANDEESFLMQTRQYRESGWPGIDNWLIFSMDGAGNPIGFAEDGKVYVSDMDCAEIIHVADNFEEYLRKECLKVDPRE